MVFVTVCCGNCGLVLFDDDDSDDISTFGAVVIKL